MEYSHHLSSEQSTTSACNISKIQEVHPNGARKGNVDSNIEAGQVTREIVHCRKATLLNRMRYIEGRGVANTLMKTRLG